MRIVSPKTIMENGTVAKEISKHSDEYEYIGVRVQEQPSPLGPLNHVSSVWDDGDETAEQLDGVCALDPNEFTYLSSFDRDHNGYFGQYVLILGADCAGIGNDPAEIIMSEPVVLACIKL